MKTDNQNRFLEWVYAVWKEAEEANNETDQDRERPRPVSLRRLSKLIGVISVVTGLILFVIYAMNGGVFESGIDYSGHGVWGMFALLLTSISLAGIVTMIFFWIFGFAPRKKLRRICLPVAFSFMVLFILGVARHSPAPVLTELGCAMISGMAFFLGLYAPERK